VQAALLFQAPFASRNGAAARAAAATAWSLKHQALQGLPAVLDIILLVLLPGSIAFAAAMDLLTLTIPNRIALLMLAAFFPAAFLASLGLPEIAAQLGTGLAVLLLGMALFFCGWCGGGDAKLVAAIALWIGFDQLVTYLLYTAVAGGVLATLLSMLRSTPLPGVLLGETWAVRLHRRDTGIPYGIALAAGALLVYPYTFWFARLAG
jgi:prepilin peptidase CpaA